MLDTSAQTDNLSLKPADKGSIRRSQIFLLCKCSWPALHFTYTHLQFTKYACGCFGSLCCFCIQTELHRYLPV